MAIVGELNPVRVLLRPLAVVVGRTFVARDRTHALQCIQHSISSPPNDIDNHAPHPPYSLPRMDESLPEDDDTNTTPKLQCPRKLKALRLLDGWSSSYYEPAFRVSLQADFLDPVFSTPRLSCVR